MAARESLKGVSAPRARRSVPRSPLAMGTGDQESGGVGEQIRAQETLQGLHKRLPQDGGRRHANDPPTGQISVGGPGDKTRSVRDGDPPMLVGDPFPESGRDATVDGRAPKSFGRIYLPQNTELTRR